MAGATMSRWASAIHAHMKTGGGTHTATADLPADWRRQMDDELRNKLKELDADRSIHQDEFTSRDVVGLWRESHSGTKKYLYRLLADGLVTVRKAYDPRVKTQVNAYRKVE